MHRQANDPTMLDNPCGDVFVDLVLNMASVKQTKPLKSFSVLTEVPHKSEHTTVDPRDVAVLVKNPDLQLQMEALGTIYLHEVMNVWQKNHSGLPCPTLLRPAGRLPLKQPQGRPAHRAGVLQPSSTLLDTPGRTLMSLFSLPPPPPVIPFDGFRIVTPS
jgi:hypothetical protein